MRYRIVHVTKYAYAKPVQFSYNEARITPKNLPDQHCISAQLQINPSVDDLNERIDFFGNRTHFFSVLQPHLELTVSATSEVTVESREVLNGTSPNASWRDSRNAALNSNDAESINCRQFTLDSPLITANDNLANYAITSFGDDMTLVEAMTDLTRRIHNDFTFDPQSTSVATPLAKVLKDRRGVCQDFAQLGIGCVRSMGIPARYVSGYLETKPPPGEDKLVGVDASHAWFSVYDPTLGWIDFDPTNDTIPTNQHVTVAWGRDFTDVTPLKGVIYGGGDHKLSVSVDVARMQD